MTTFRPIHSEHHRSTAFVHFVLQINWELSRKRSTLFYNYNYQMLWSSAQRVGTLNRFFWQYLTFWRTIVERFRDSNWDTAISQTKRQSIGSAFLPLTDIPFKWLKPKEMRQWMIRKDKNVLSNKNCFYYIIYFSKIKR